MQPPSATTATASATSMGKSAVDAKIEADLAVVKEKMDLCEKMLNPADGSPAPSLKHNDTMLTVVGFLEACAPRMVELVQAAQDNVLSEHVLMDCLAVNDSLQKMLADIDTIAETETTASTTAASAPKPSTSIEQELDDLLLDDSAASPEDIVAGGKTTGEDLFDNELLSPTPAATETKQPAVEHQPMPAPSADPFGNEVLTPVSAQAEPAAASSTSDPFANETLTAAVSESDAAAKQAQPIPTTGDDFDSFLAERTTKE